MFSYELVRSPRCRVVNPVIRQPGQIQIPQTCQAYLPTPHRNERSISIQRMQPTSTDNPPHSPLSLILRLFPLDYTSPSTPNPSTTALSRSRKDGSFQSPAEHSEDKALGGKGVGNKSFMMPRSKARDQAYCSSCGTGTKHSQQPRDDNSHDWLEVASISVLAGTIDN